MEPPTNGLDPSPMDEACRCLALGQPKPNFLDDLLWQDLQVSFRPQLRALRPGLKRPRLRISSNAALRRLTARLSKAGLREMNRRLIEYCVPDSD